MLLLFTVITSHDSRGKSSSQASAKVMKDNLRAALCVLSTLSTLYNTYCMLMDGTAFLEVGTSLYRDEFPQTV